MKTAAIYCRVSTEDQEREGTSLQTQLEACLGKAKELGYDVPKDNVISESFTGARLERPGLVKIRTWVKNNDIDAVICFDPDRLARDFVLLMVLANELEEGGAELVFVTQTVGKTPEDRMLFGMRGLFAEYERAKIRSRTFQGRQARAKQGRIPSGGFAKLYGYDYIKAGNDNGGRRVINETEAKWVRQIYRWLVDEGMSTTAITFRLRAVNAPTKDGGLWARSSVLAILKNPAYTGKTYAFTMRAGDAKFSRPREEWIEMPGVTPGVIDEALFQAAQRQLQVNRQKALRNVRREYLLRGHLYCRQCGRAYWSQSTTRHRNGKSYAWRRYQCSGTKPILVPVNHCGNISWAADRLEALVWEQIERLLDKPELIITEIERQRQGANQIGVFEAEVQLIHRQLKALDHEQKELLDNALRGFPESLIVAENKRINERRATLEAQKTELEVQIKASEEAAVNLPNLERYVDLIRQKLTTLDYETKRMALEMLNIKVWLDGYNVEVTGVLPVGNQAIVTTPTG